MSYFSTIRFYIIIVMLIGTSMYMTFISTNVLYSELTQALDPLANGLPDIIDPNFKLELIFQKEIERKGGTLSPVSSMAFLDVNDFLLLNKNDGTVHRIVNGVLLVEPLLDVNVANSRERGMLGIAITDQPISNDKKNTSSRYVFLYYTESENTDGSEVCRATYYCKDDNETLGNNLYRYVLKDKKLIDPELLIQLPAWPAPSHNGGVITIGPDNNLYVTVGDLVGSENDTSKTKAQNYKSGTKPDGRAGILRLTQDGNAVSQPELGDEFPLNLYYAYGIRNSFGIDFDPITQKLWDTENGPDYGDEINLVEAGFNSGWGKIQGLWEPWYNATRGGDLIAGKEWLNPDPKEFEDFKGKGKYSPPEFVWNQTVGPTQIKFLDSDRYPEEYRNDLFVGDTNNGYLYHFDLTEDRKALLLHDGLSDRVANNVTELDSVILGRGFGQITDIEIGPDGYLYILSHLNNVAMIFKITSDFRT